MARALELSGLTLRFGGQAVLDDVSIAAPEGAAVGVIGPNGAGKTSVFNCISRVYHPSAGTIAVGGRDLAGVRPHQLAREGVARSFQGTALPPRNTALENVLLGAHTRFRATWVEGVLGLPRSRGAERRERAKARDLLARVGLGDDADTTMELLPMGHQKLVDIARCLMSDPHVLLLDEPVAATSQSERDRVKALLAELIATRELTVLLVEHDVSFVADLVDETVVLDFGRVIAQGAPREVLEDPRVVAAYLGSAQEQ